MGAFNLPRGYGKPSNVQQVTSDWSSPEDLERAARDPDPDNPLYYRPGSIWLGRTSYGTPVGWTDNRHQVLIAGSRAGKGRDAIIPVLCTYPGSVLVVDPKGENASRTAAQRGIGSTDLPTPLHQRVYVLDPYNASKGTKDYQATFNPLTLISEANPEAIEDAGLIADALVLSGRSNDPHWDDSAKMFIAALILHLCSWKAYSHSRTMGTLHRLLFKGDEAEHQKQTAEVLDIARDEPQVPSRLKAAKHATPFWFLMKTMSKNEAFNGAVATVGQAYLDMSDRERNSILSTARRNLQFLASPQMKRVLDNSDHSLDLDDFKKAKDEISVYVVLPARRLSTHSRWVRLILNLAMARMETNEDQDKATHPVLAVCDEFPILGYLASIETAVGYMAGFNLRVWAILQDLNQLKRHYPDSWESFIANAGLLCAFGVTDQTTLEYLSKRLGEIEVIRETESFSVAESEGEQGMSDLQIDQVHKDSSAIGRVAGRASLDAESTTSKSKNRQETQNFNQQITKAALLSPDEIAAHFSRESMKQIVFAGGALKLIVDRTPYYQDKMFEQKFVGAM